MSSRRRDVAGIVEDKVERRDDASSGRGISALLSSFLRFLLRCGSSEESIKVSVIDWPCEISSDVAVGASCEIGGRVASANLCAGIDVCHSALEMSSLSLAEKYSLRSNFPSLGLAAIASLCDGETLNGRLKVLVLLRRSRHLTHMWRVSSRRDLEALARNDMPPISTASFFLFS